MTDQVIAVFENRLSNMEWMGRETQDEAVKKLKAIEIRIGYIRVNAVLSSMDQFYEVYGIEEGDGMYYPPEERPEIW